jgi:hypothetical protein
MDTLAIVSVATTGAGTLVALAGELIRGRRSSARDRADRSLIEFAISGRGEESSIAIAVPAGDQAAVEKALLDVFAREASASEAEPAPSASPDVATP